MCRFWLFLRFAHHSVFASADKFKHAENELCGKMISIVHERFIPKYEHFRCFFARGSTYWMCLPHTLWCLSPDTLRTSKQYHLRGVLFTSKHTPQYTNTQSGCGLGLGSQLFLPWKHSFVSPHQATKDSRKIFLLWKEAKKKLERKVSTTHVAGCSCNLIWGSAIRGDVCISQFSVDKSTLPFLVTAKLLHQLKQKFHTLLNYSAFIIQLHCWFTLMQLDKPSVMEFPFERVLGFAKNIVVSTCTQKNSNFVLHWLSLRWSKLILMWISFVG